MEGIAAGPLPIPSQNLMLKIAIGMAHRELFAKDRKKLRRERLFVAKDNLLG